MYPSVLKVFSCIVKGAHGWACIGHIVLNDDVMLKLWLNPRSRIHNRTQVPSAQRHKRNLFRSGEIASRFLNYEVCLAHGWHVRHAAAASTVNVWVAGNVSYVSSTWNSHHYERMLSIPQSHIPPLLWENVKFGPSVTVRRAGPSSWWPSMVVKIFTSASLITCLTFAVHFSKSKYNHRNTFKKQIC